MNFLKNTLSKIKGAFGIGKTLNKYAPKPTPATQTIEWAGQPYLAGQWRAQNKMITPSKYDMSKAVSMIKPDPKYNAQVGTGAMAPYPKFPNLPDTGYTWLSMSAGAEAKIPTAKPRWGTGWAWAPAVAAETPAAPNLQQDVAWLLSKAGYTSNYKPKKDMLANLTKDEKERYLRMYGPFKSIE